MSCTFNNLTDVQKSSVILSFVGALVVFLSITGMGKNVPMMAGFFGKNKSHMFMYALLAAFSFFAISFFDKGNGMMEGDIEKLGYSDDQKVSIGFSLAAGALLLVIMMVRMKMMKTPSFLNDMSGIGSKGERSTMHKLVYAFLMVSYLLPITFVDGCVA